MFAPLDYDTTKLADRKLGAIVRGGARRAILHGMSVTGGEAGSG
jgi:hypothetical protein